MGKQKHKAHKSNLPPEARKLGKQHIYILVGMIVIGILVGLYQVNQ